MVIVRLVDLTHTPDADATDNEIAARDALAWRKRSKLQKGASAFSAVPSRRGEGTSARVADIQVGVDLEYPTPDQLPNRPLEKRILVGTQGSRRGHRRASLIRVRSALNRTNADGYRHRRGTHLAGKSRRC